MTLTPSELESLTSALSRWEIAEYVFSALVTFACAGEAIATFTDWFTSGLNERKERLEKGSTVLLVAALALELVCLVKTNQLSGMVIGSLNQQSEQALDNAKKALSVSGGAIKQAGEAISAAAMARGTSANALDTSKEATGAAANALFLARGVRQEVGSVKQEVNEATTQLSSAQAKAVSAEQRAQEAQKELINLAICNSPRVIPE